MLTVGYHFIKWLIFIILTPIMIFGQTKVQTNDTILKNDSIKIDTAKIDTTYNFVPDSIYKTVVYKYNVDSVLLEVIYKKANMFFKQKEWYNALKYFNLYFEKTDSSKISLEDYYKQIICFYNVATPGDYETNKIVTEQKLPILKKLLSKYPDDIKLKLAYAKINTLIDQGKNIFTRKKFLKKAKIILDSLLTVDSTIKDTYILLAEWHFQLQEYPKLFLKLLGLKSQGNKDALKILLKAKKIFPKDIEVLYYLGIAYSRNYKIPEAILTFRSIRFLKPTNQKEKIYKNKALIYLINLTY